MIAFISTMVSDPSDREFMTSFYEKYYRLMFSVSRGICKEYYDSEEVVQDSIVKLISKISLLRSLPVALGDLMMIAESFTTNSEVVF